MNELLVLAFLISQQQRPDPIAFERNHGQIVSLGNEAHVQVSFQGYTPGDQDSGDITFEPVSNGLVRIHMKPRAADAPISIVTDVDRLNRFVEAYNAYAGQLRRGIVDLRLWNQFVSAFRKLTQ